MANEKKGSGALSFILAIVVTVVLFVYITACNLLNFDVLFKFGPRQYAYNLVHLHKDYPCTAKREIKVYQNMIPIEEMGTTGAYTLKSGDRFALKGYRSPGYVTWIAVEFYIKNAQVNGYAYIPEDIPISTFAAAMPFSKDEIANSYFRQVRDDELAAVRESYKARLLAAASRQCRLQKAVGPEEMQRIKESKTYRLIPPEYVRTEANTAYYCPREQFDIVERLYETYLGDNFNTLLYQNSDYDPESDGVFRDGIFYRVIGSIYFKIAAVAAVILFALV